MRTNIEIDVELMKSAMKAINAKTKKETVEHGLQLIIHHAARKDIRKLRGKVEMYPDADGISTKVVSENDG